MKTKFYIIVITVILFNNLPVFSSQFEELDKPPEGAHAGQMLLGGFFSIGLPSGDTIKAEENFITNNTYTFEESQITKELLITHLSYDFGFFYEYIPIDHVGAKIKLRRSVVVQRTAFGTDYQNWNENLYQNISLLLGPSFHLTARKQWDITLTPMAGYAFAEYNATPVAAKLISGYTGDMKRDVNNFFYGAELALSIYFSGGFYLSLGCDWTSYNLSFSPAFNLSQNGNSYLDGKSSASLQTLNLIISAGYAFSN